MKRLSLRAGGFDHGRFVRTRSRDVYKCPGAHRTRPSHATHPDARDASTCLAESRNETHLVCVRAVSSCSPIGMSELKRVDCRATEIVVSAPRRARRSAGGGTVDLAANAQWKGTRLRIVRLRLRPVAGRVARQTVRSAELTVETIAALDRTAGRPNVVATPCVARASSRPSEIAGATARPLQPAQAKPWPELVDAREAGYFRMQQIVGVRPT